MKEELEIALTTYMALKHTQEECVGFIDGFESAVERMYSEEEVLQILFRFTNKFDLQKNIEITAEMQNEWFEQFKKK